MWDSSSDNFIFKVNETALRDQKLKSTKREVLRTIMKFFDILGFVSHFIIRAKILMQQIWKKGIEWDQKLPDNLQQSWLVWLQDLSQLSQIRIPRCYTTRSLNDAIVEMHTFVDASESAYAAVTYFRIIYDDRIEVAFVGSKSKVAPTKTVSIPRLELQGALLGARFATNIQQLHTCNIQRRIFWTDAKVVIDWISSETRKFKPFVAVRIGEILDLTTTNEWRYVSSKLNVADIATKWQANTNIWIPTWFNGPEFLNLRDENLWPKSKSSTENVSDLIQEENVFLIVPDKDVSFFAINEVKFSNWRKFVRTIAYVKRFINIKIKKQLPQNNWLSVQELRDAEEIIIRKAQWEAYPYEVSALLADEEIEPGSPITNLSPGIGHDGILRLHSRLQNAPKVSYEMKNPAILPQHHIITRLIVKHFHEKFLHGGQEAILSSIRQRYWIVNARSVIKRIKSSCQYCKNRSAKPNFPLMGQLPACRATANLKPFTNAGVDLFGPIQVTVKRHHEKRYGVIFTCMMTRAIHLELANSLSSDSFLLCLRNFVYRRGAVSNIWSDNGTNFVGANRELQDELSKIKYVLAEHAVNMEITWHFNPPASPHFGGVYERLIQSVKKCLMILLNTRFPQEDTLRSALIETEFIVNSRPLTHVPVDSYEDEPLTPNHFLIGYSGAATSLITYDDTNYNSRQQWKNATLLSNLFWKRWVKEYLPEITRRSKWYRNVKPVQVGDVGVLVDENAPRNTWKKVLITEVHPGKDGVVRAVTVKTSAGELKRPVHKIAILDISSSYNSNN
jgi:hypothetical protein